MAFDKYSDLEKLISKEFDQYGLTTVLTSDKLYTKFKLKNLQKERSIIYGDPKNIITNVETLAFFSPVKKYSVVLNIMPLNHIELRVGFSLTKTFKVNIAKPYAKFINDLRTSTGLLSNYNIFSNTFIFSSGYHFINSIANHHKIISEINLFLNLVNSALETELIKKYADLKKETSVEDIKDIATFPYNLKDYKNHEYYFYDE